MYTHSGVVGAASQPKSSKQIEGVALRQEIKGAGLASHTPTYTEPKAKLMRMRGLDYPDLVRCVTAPVGPRSPGLSFGPPVADAY